MLLFYCTFGIYIKFWTFWKKTEPNYLWNYWLRKTLLPKRIKGPVSENPSAVNMLLSPKKLLKTSSKNCWNLQKNTFLLYFCHYKLNWVSKSQFCPDEILALLAKTLTAVDEYSRYNTENLPLPIKCNYLKNLGHFASFLLHFWNLH